MLEQILLSGKLGDGCLLRQYVTIHKITMLEFLKDLQEFVINNDIKTMFYKADLPSTTIS
jgi:hypothetical protein